MRPIAPNYNTYVRLTEHESKKNKTRMYLEVSNEVVIFTGSVTKVLIEKLWLRHQWQFCKMKN